MSYEGKHLKFDWYMPLIQIIYSDKKYCKLNIFDKIRIIRLYSKASIQWWKIFANLLVIKFESHLPLRE